MSLYIGKSTENENIVHITKDHQSKDTLRKGVNSNTVFHSSLPLSSYALIPVSRAYYRFHREFYLSDKGFNHALVETCFCRITNGEEDYEYVPITGAHAYNISQEDKELLINTLKTTPNRVMFLDSQMQLVPGCGVANVMLFTGYSARWGQYWTSKLDSRYTLAIADFHKGVDIGPIAYILILRDDYYPGVKGSVRIDNSGIYVGGVSLFKGKNLLANSYSPDSGGIKITDTLVLLPSTVTQQGNMSISTDLNGTTKILLGKTPIFDSRNNYYAPSKPVTRIVKELTLDFIGATKETLLYSLKDSEGYCSVQAERRVWNEIFYPSVIVARNQNTRCSLYVHSYGGGWVTDINFEYIEIRGKDIYLVYKSTKVTKGWKEKYIITAY